MASRTIDSHLPRSLWRALATGIVAASLSGPDPASAGEILLKLRNADAITPLLTQYGLTLESRLGARPIFRLAVAAPLADVPAIVAALRREPSVLLAEENAFNGSPEARKNRVWAIGTAQDFAKHWAPATLQLAQAHEMSTGNGIRIAVLDTGVDPFHPLLAGRLLWDKGYDFVDGDANPAEEGGQGDLGFGHGTHVAGIIARAAPRAKIVPIRVLDRHGAGNAWVIAEALLFAVDPDGDPATDDGAHVVNLSLGTPERTDILDAVVELATCSIPQLGQPLSPERDISDPSYDADKERCRSSRGAVVLAAAGNDASIELEFPAGAGAAGMAAVAASDQRRLISASSNFGSWIDLAAPGELITSSVPGRCVGARGAPVGCYGTWSGTSMAAPWASATAALLRASAPHLSPVEVVDVLKRSTSYLRGTALRQLDPLAALSELACGPAPFDSDHFVVDSRQCGRAGVGVQ